MARIQRRQQPEMRALDGIDSRDATIQRAQAGGITTANLMPGSGHLISGQTVYAKLRDVGSVDEMFITLPDGRMAGGVKMANGTNPIKQASYAKFPGTRAKSAALVREAFVAAQEYRDKLARNADAPEKRPARDLGLEILVDVLEGRRTVQHHTHRHDDILTVLRLKREFGFNVVLQHVSDGWKVADQIAAAGVANSKPPTSPGAPVPCSKKPASWSDSTPTTTSPTPGSCFDPPRWRSEAV